MKRSIITLTTDFGTAGEYTGAMKGVILGINPAARIVDITHEIEPQNILQASWVAAKACPYFPPGTIHVVVVDPGVGTDRRGILVETKRGFFVGPDNGVFTPLLQKDARLYELTRTKFFLPEISSTFHGRDIFAPVAGHLSRGVAPRSFGRKAADPVRLDWPRPAFSRGTLTGQVLWADNFGNLITNIRREDCGEEAEARALEVRARRWKMQGISRTYAEAQPGRPVALFGSGGTLEISVNRGNASVELGLGPGDKVAVHLR
ncbi:MAG TPA: SAM-dependent chlorinase/fluorinase [Thermodesulfobacteriota bacterium]|nr:SAM-dependent chlorinase/fluorinase [Thermodesulfobacteriota bacterium]